MKILSALLLIPLIFSIEVPIGKNLYKSMDEVLLNVKEYYDDCGEYPLDPDGLTQLIESDKECWRGPYSKELDIVDPVSRVRYKILYKDKEVVIISAGLDGKFNTYDDMSSADDNHKKKFLINLYLESEREKDIAFYILIVLTAAIFLVGLIFYKKRINLLKKSDL